MSTIGRLSSGFGRPENRALAEEEGDPADDATSSKPRNGGVEDIPAIAC